MDHKNSYSASYAAAGVDITAGYRAVELMKKHVARTRNEGCLDDVGGFGGCFGLPIAGMEEPVLVSGTDGCGTFRDMATVTEFVVDDTDGYGYYSVNGVLYHYDETDDGNIKTLVKVPEGKVLDGSYTAEIGTDVIGEKAFYNQEKLQTVFLPESVTKISTDAFYGCDSLTGIYFHGAPPTTLVKRPIPDGVTLYYIEGTDGWTDPWEGYDTDVFVPDTPPKGDINGDSAVDENDSDALKRYFAGWLKRFSDLIDNFRDYKEEDERNPYDINNDGVFNARDLMLLVRYLADWEGYDQYFKDKAN